MTSHIVYHYAYSLYTGCWIQTLISLNIFPSWLFI